MKNSNREKEKSQADAATQADAGNCPIACSAGEVNVGRTERTISSCVGGLLLLCGLSRMRMDAFLIMLAGGSLLYRGMTGHCHGYDMLGINTAEPEESQGPREWSVEQSETAAV
jgi:uncharacterized membrane protein